MTGPARSILWSLRKGATDRQAHKQRNQHVTGRQLRETEAKTRSSRDEEAELGYGTELTALTGLDVG